MGKKQGPEERFDTKYIVDENTGCWQWIGAIDDSGYGEFGLNKKIVYAHRYSWELEHGPIPEGLQIDHLCRNRACVNPVHMELVTTQENTRRGARRGRPWEPPEPEPGR